MAVAATASAGQRRLLFGVNVLVSSALAIIVLVAAVWLSKRFKTEVDLTAEAVNSLSSRETKLLAGLKEDIKITAFHSVDRKSDELGAKRRDKVRDLLVLYDQAGGARVDARMGDPLEDPGPAQERARVQGRGGAAPDGARKAGAAVRACGQVCGR